MCHAWLPQPAVDADHSCSGSIFCDEHGWTMLNWHRTFGDGVFSSPLVPHLTQDLSFLQQNPSNTPMVLAPYSQHRCFKCGVDFDLPNWGRSINSAFDATRVALAKLKKLLGTDRAALREFMQMLVFFKRWNRWEMGPGLGNMPSNLYTLKKKKHPLPKYLEDSNSWKPESSKCFFQSTGYRNIDAY